MYSLVIAAVIAIAARELTRLHATFVLVVVASPLSIYFLFHAIRRSVSDKCARLDAVFGHDNIWQTRFNRAAVLAMFPFWLAVLVIIIQRPTWFQQTACDKVDGQGLTSRFFLEPIFLLSSRSLAQDAVILSLFFALLVAWVVAVVSMRSVIFKTDKDIAYIPLRIWRKTTNHYPFLLFCTVIFFPSNTWIGILESGADFSNEYFQPTYGQLLAIFVAVPPAVQCALMYKRCFYWFMNLAWARFVSGRRHMPLYGVTEDEDERHKRLRSTSMTSLGSYATLYDPPSLPLRQDPLSQPLNITMPIAKPTSARID